MSKLLVQSCKFKKEFTTGSGIALRSYTVMGLLDGDLDSVEMNAKSDLTAPKVGETIEVTVEETQYGKKAKKVQQNAFQGGSRPAHTDDPAKQAMIVRQNALTNAVAFLSAIGTIEKTSLGLTEENVLLVATKFAAFSQGTPLPASVVDVVKNTPPSYFDDAPFPEEE